MKHIACTFVLFITCIFLSPLEGKGKYSQIYETFKHMPSNKLVELGDLFFSKNVSDSALICYTIISSRYYPQANNEEKYLIAHAYNRLGIIHYSMYNYIRAQEFYLKSLNICEECNYKRYIPRIYNNIGNIYASFSDFKRAKEYYKKALQESMNHSDSETTLMILGNLIGVCCNLNETSNTRYYLKLSNLLNKGEKKEYLNLSAKSDIALKNKDYKLAIKYAKQSFHLTDSLSLSPRLKCASLNDIAGIFITARQNDSALYYLFKSEQIAKENTLLEMQHYIYKRIAETQRTIGNRELYLHYNDLYRSLDDSIMNTKTYGSIKDIEFMFEMDQVDKQILDMRIEQAKKDYQLSQQRSIILTVSIILLIIVFFLIVTYRQKKKLMNSYKYIFNRNIEVVEAEKRMKQEHLKFQEALNEKENYILQLEYLATNTQSQDVNKTTENSNKYQGSSLNEEQKQKLIKTINGIMENSMEFCNADFSLERLAYLAGSKSKYVSQTINEIYKKNFNRYINEFRIKEARSRLTNLKEYGHYTVKGIAQSVGFKSVTNFNTLFKEITGITPAIYQKMMLHSGKNEELTS